MLYWLSSDSWKLNADHKKLLLGKLTLLDSEKYNDPTLFAQSFWKAKI
jgi:hypothetical protein